LTCVLSIANQKGGVGKTTTSINLAAALAIKKKRTLLIDLDPQSNASIAFFSSDEIQTTMYDIFAEHPVELAKIIRPTKDPNLHVAPARLALARLEQQLAGQFDAPFKLKDALAPILKNYDYIVLDTPPALGILTVNAWSPRRICSFRFKPPTLPSRAPTTFSKPTAASARVRIPT